LHAHPHQHSDHISRRHPGSLSRQYAPIDGRAKQIVRVIVIIIGALSLLRHLAVF